MVKCMTNAEWTQFCVTAERILSPNRIFEENPIISIFMCKLSNIDN
jgi:hypothetical protein